MVFFVMTSFTVTACNGNERKRNPRPKHSTIPANFSYLRTQNNLFGEAEKHLATGGLGFVTVRI